MSRLRIRLGVWLLKPFLIAHLLAAEPLIDQFDDGKVPAVENRYWMGRWTGVRLILERKHPLR